MQSLSFVCCAIGGTIFILVLIMELIPRVKYNNNYSLDTCIITNMKVIPYYCYTFANSRCDTRTVYPSCDAFASIRPRVDGTCVDTHHQCCIWMVKSTCQLYVPETVDLKWNTCYDFFISVQRENTSIEENVLTCQSTECVSLHTPDFVVGSTFKCWVHTSGSITSIDPRKSIDASIAGVTIGGIFMFAGGIICIVMCCGYIGRQRLSRRIRHDFSATTVEIVKL